MLGGALGELSHGKGSRSPAVVPRPMAFFLRTNLAIVAEGGFQLSKISLKSGNIKRNNSVILSEIPDDVALVGRVLCRHNNTVLAAVSFKAAEQTFANFKILRCPEHFISINKCRRKYHSRGGIVGYHNSRFVAVLNLYEVVLSVLATLHEAEEKEL